MKRSGQLRGFTRRPCDAMNSFHLEMSRDGSWVPSVGFARALRAIARSAPALSASEVRTEYMVLATQSSASTNPIQRPCAALNPAFLADERPPFGFEISLSDFPSGGVTGFDNLTRSVR